MTDVTSGGDPRDFERSGTDRTAGSPRHSPLLTRDEELDLAERWRDAKDESALHRLITAHSRLVIKLARRFRHYGLPMNDLVQEGHIGLLQAAQKFEPERGFRFSTYASWWIRSAIQDYVLRNWSIVRTGTTAGQKSLFFNLNRLRRKYAKAYDGWLNEDGKAGIASELKVRQIDVAHMEQRMAGNDRSLNAEYGNSTVEQWQDHLTDDNPNPEDVYIAVNEAEYRRRQLQAALSTLTPREQAIIRARRLSESTTTLGELGTQLGLSKERVRQIEFSALEKLQKAITGPATLRPQSL